jgi:nicotinamide mononucleotide (NMN) deamidase PncC
MRDLVRAIHDSPYKIAIAVTGGGIGAIHDLFTTPGASRSMLEGLIPYDSGALNDLLGGKPDQYCSSATARAMAMACYQRASALTNGSQSILGVGCTASLVSDHPKHGEHRCHIALQSASTTQVMTVRLKKGLRTRQEEDVVASNFVLQLLHSAATNTTSQFGAGLAEETIEPQQINAPIGWRRLLAAECCWASKEGAEFGDSLAPEPTPRLAIYSGAFNPRHEAHTQIGRIGNQRFGRVLFELSIRNVDKPPLDFIEMATRAAQFSSDEELIFTRSPTFVEKARVFPDATFLVGVDTIRRISEPRYYGSERERDQAVAELTERGCRFLVFGRSVDGAFHEFDPSEVTPALAPICEGVTEEEFRLDISSTAIRDNQQSDV